MSPALHRKEVPRFDLLAVDLDGTLLDSSRRIPPENRDALLRAHAARVRIAIVTGRRLPAAESLLSGIGMDPLLVLNGGALIKEGLRGPMLHRRLLPMALGSEVLAAGRSAGMEPVIHDGPEGEGHLITETPRGNNRALAIYLEKSTPPPRYVTDLPGSLQRDPVEIMFADSVERVRWLETELASRLGGRVHLARTEYAEQNWSLLDVLAEGASKADALSFLAAGHGIPHQRIMAIGDNWNDLGMLEACGLAVVMGNAAAGLRARGFETTATNDEAGVARAIDRYLF